MEKILADNSKKSIRFDVITLFPKLIEAYTHASIIGRARARGIIDVRLHNLRDFGEGTHKKVDARPYGGGAGMVLMAEPLVKAAKKAMSASRTRIKVVLFSAKGKPFSQKIASEWAKKYARIVLIAGRYEGIDERVTKILHAEEISIGPYVLTDGDVASMAVISSITRLIPGAIRLESLAEESHGNLLKKHEVKTVGAKELEYPHYTRPEVLTVGKKKYSVPKVLLSGDHKKIEEWRRHM